MKVYLEISKSFWLWIPSQLDFLKNIFPFLKQMIYKDRYIFSPKIEMYIFHLCVLWPRCFDYDSWVHYRDPNPNSSVYNLLIGNRSRWSNDLWLLEMFLGKYFFFFFFLFLFFFFFFFFCSIINFLLISGLLYQTKWTRLWWRSRGSCWTHGALGPWRCP